MKNVKDFYSDIIEHLNKIQEDYVFKAIPDNNIETFVKLKEALPLCPLLKNEKKGPIPIVLYPIDLDKEYSLEELCTDILDNIKGLLKDAEDVSPFTSEELSDIMNQCFTLDYLKKNVIISLEKDKLIDCISREFFGSFLCLKIQIDIDKEDMTNVAEIFLTEDFVEKINKNENTSISIDELFELGKRNVLNKNGIELTPLNEFMRDSFMELQSFFEKDLTDIIFNDLKNGDDMESLTKQDLINFLNDTNNGAFSSVSEYIIENAQGTNCTGLMFNPRVLEMFKQEFKEDFCFITISETKMLVSPASSMAKTNPKNLINSFKSIVDKNMLLDKILLYSIEEDSFKEYLGSEKLSK